MQTKQKISNMTELITDLSTVYSNLRIGKISSEEARDVAIISSKIIKAAAVQLKYNQFIGNNKPIKFLTTK